MPLLTPAFSTLRTSGSPLIIDTGSFLKHPARDPESGLLWLWGIAAELGTSRALRQTLGFHGTPPHAPSQGNAVGVYHRPGESLWIVGDAPGARRLLQGFAHRRISMLWLDQSLLSELTAGSDLPPLSLMHHQHMRTRQHAPAHPPTPCVGLARPQERSQLIVLDVEQHGQKLSHVDYRHLIERECVWVARDAETERVVASLKVTRVDPLLAWISALWTSPHARRRGHARRLVDAVTDALWREENRRCALNVEASNHAALELYQRAGYQRVSEVIRVRCDDAAGRAWLRQMTAKSARAGAIPLPPLRGVEARAGRR